MDPNTFANQDGSATSVILASTLTGPYSTSFVESRSPGAGLVGRLDHGNLSPKDGIAVPISVSVPFSVSDAFPNAWHIVRGGTYHVSQFDVPNNRLDYFETHILQTIQTNMDMNANWVL